MYLLGKSLFGYYIRGGKSTSWCGSTIVQTILQLAAALITCDLRYPFMQSVQFMKLPSYCHSKLPRHSKASTHAGKTDGVLHNRLCGFHATKWARSRPLSNPGATPRALLCGTYTSTCFFLEPWRVRTNTIWHWWHAGLNHSGIAHSMTTLQAALQSLVTTLLAVGRGIFFIFSCCTESAFLIGEINGRYSRTLQARDAETVVNLQIGVVSSHLCCFLPKNFQNPSDSWVANNS